MKKMINIKDNSNKRIGFGTVMSGVDSYSAKSVYEDCDRRINDLWRYVLELEKEIEQLKKLLQENNDVQS